jgi:hypothetical protein
VGLRDLWNQWDPEDLSPPEDLVHPEDPARLALLLDLRNPGDPVYLVHRECQRGQARRKCRKDRVTLEDLEDL